MQRSAAPVTAWCAAGNPLRSAAWAGAAEITPKPVYRYAPRTKAEESRRFPCHNGQPPGDDGSPPQPPAGPPRRTPRLAPAGKGKTGHPFLHRGWGGGSRPPAPLTRPGSPRRRPIYMRRPCCRTSVYRPPRFATRPHPKWSSSAHTRLVRVTRATGADPIRAYHELPQNGAGASQRLT